MSLNIRNVDVKDLEAVLSLNESEVPHVGRVDLSQMQWFAHHASYFRVAESNGALAAFLIGLRPGADYDSPNYRWFGKRYEDFAYVDRVAVAEFARRAGLASRLYADFAAAQPDIVTRMTCEVNIRPPNVSSMRFHERLGFTQVGTLESEDGTKAVAMLLKNL